MSCTTISYRNVWVVTSYDVSLQDWYGTSPEVTPTAADASHLTADSFKRAPSDVFHTPAGSRSTSMDFGILMDQQEVARSAAQGDAATSGEGDGKDGAGGGRHLVSGSRLANQSFAAIPEGTSRESSLGAAGLLATSAADGEASAAAEGATSTAQPASQPVSALPLQQQQEQTPAFAGAADQHDSLQAVDADRLDGVEDTEAATPPQKPGSAAEPNTDAAGDPLHPWSIANPPPVSLPQLQQQAAVATISLADASAPVGDAPMRRQILMLRSAQLFLAPCDRATTVSNYTTGWQACT